MSNDLIPRTSSGQIRVPSKSEIAQSTGQKSLDLFEEGFYAPVGIQWDARSVTIPGNISFEDWRSRMCILLEKGQQLEYHAADFLDFGQKHFSVSYAQAVEMAGQSDRILGKLLSLAKVAPKNRKAKLSVDHHVAVAHEPERVQQVILDLAVQNSWSVQAVHEQVSQLKQHVANFRPQAVLVETPIVTVGEVRFRMTGDAWREAGILHLSPGELARQSILVTNHVRSRGTGETFMHDDIPTSAVYEGMNENENDGRDAGCTELVPISLVREPVKPLPVEPYQEPLTEDRTWRLTDEEAIAKLSASGRVTAYLEIAGRATNPQMAEAMRLSKRTIDGATKSLSESGRIIRTGEVDTTSTSSTPPAYWALPGRGQEVIEGEWQNAQGAA